MSGQTNPPLFSSAEEIHQYLQFFPNPDGTVTRNSIFPDIPPTPDPHDDHLSNSNSNPVLSKDIPINQSNNTWARLYLPKQHLALLDSDNNNNNNNNNNKLPLIVYIHGGGFVLLCPPSSSLNHNFCSAMAVDLAAVVVSIEYRMAPEHRLPAAYEDAAEALHWIRTTQEACLREYADYTNCFIMGSSAGGNITYHAALRFLAPHEDDDDDDLHPTLKIRGLILHQPFFGGTQRTQSELRLAHDPILPPPVTDFLWDHSLPVGADRDHEYSNPTAAGGGSKSLESLVEGKVKVMVTGCEGDPLIDRQMGLAKFVSDKGIETVARFGQGGSHGFEVMDPTTKAKELFIAIKEFIVSH
ncbi:hypothetical protein Tsubulata_025403 [Turnera subulata]|uniref:Alpha/beta hydrolase fold-3 domain-containing protein n=1 Tax=Turnera subulata TaxID=218843 RepID=A0A9Q0JJ41_9ROSI|nr:hypothetical protein Tsubulata_025403 [Turnera subulata]